MGKMSQQAENDREHLNLETPYPRSILVSEQVPWCERLPWILAPYASFALNICLAKFRPEVDLPIGPAPPIILVYTVGLLVALLIWVLGCLVALMEIIGTVTRITEGRAWVANISNALISVIAVLAAASGFLFIWVGPD